jgi:hypothetical protein
MLNGCQYGELTLDEAAAGRGRRGHSRLDPCRLPPPGFARSVIYGVD